MTLTLRSVEKEYGPGEKPKFELTATNERGHACKIDLGRTATIVTITRRRRRQVLGLRRLSAGREAAPRQVPASGDSAHTLTWYRKHSAANCGTPACESPKPGTYEVEVEVKGLKMVHTSFKLVK